MVTTEADQRAAVVDEDGVPLPIVTARWRLAALMLCALASPAYAVTASCYGNENHQIRTAQGYPYNPWLLTAAHKTLPFGTKLRIGYHGRSVVVRINDRGPYVHGRDLDLSLGACRVLGLSLGNVSMERRLK